MKPIPVTKPFLPPLEEYTEMLADIWQRKWLTNNGRYHQELEKALADYHAAPHCSLFCNGTVALQAALSVLGIKNEVITTPFSFVATAHAVSLTGCQPVFVDIEPGTCNLDPDKVEAAVTENTTAILPVHVYGTPCNHHALQAIADKYQLKIIYDAAHAFGIVKNGENIVNFGDLSVVSFHATKVFSTVEGGAVFTASREIKRKLDLFRNFGIAGETKTELIGTNGKMNELQAAFGLLNLKYINDNIARRKRIDSIYRQNIDKIKGLEYLPESPDIKYNYGYFPVFIDQSLYGASRDQLYLKLREHDILSRRYFYPLITHFPDYHECTGAAPANLGAAEAVAAEVLCLPIYPDLAEEEQNRIIEILTEQT